MYTRLLAAWLLSCLIVATPYDQCPAVTSTVTRWYSASQTEQRGTTVTSTVTSYISTQKGEINRYGSGYGKGGNGKDTITETVTCTETYTERQPGYSQPVSTPAYESVSTRTYGQSTTKKSNSSDSKKSSSSSHTPTTSSKASHTTSLTSSYKYHNTTATCTGILHQCTSTVLQQCSASAHPAGTTIISTVTATTFLTTNGGTATSTSLTTTELTLTSTSTAPAVTITDSTTTTVDTTTTSISIESDTETDTSSTVSVVTPPASLPFRKRTESTPTSEPKSDACSVKDFSSACSCLGVKQTSAPAPSISTTTITVTSTIGATASTTAASTITSSTSTTAVTTPTTTTEQVSTETDTFTTDSTSTTTTTTTTLVVSTSTAPTPLFTFGVLFVPTDASIAETRAFIGHPPFFGNQPSNIYQIGSQSINDQTNQALFVLDRATGHLISQNAMTQGDAASYATGGESFVAVTDAQGQSDFGTDTFLNCQLNSGTFQITCMDGSGPGTFYLCANFLTITDNAQGDVGCAFGANTQVNLFATTDL